MLQTFINSPDDMRWLRETHGVNLRGMKSAVVHGNMDAPTMVEVYKSRNPDLHESPAVWSEAGLHKGELVRIR